MTRRDDPGTRAYFDRIATARGEVWAGNVNKWRVIEPLFEGVAAGANVLECGSGSGLYTCQMLERGFRVRAVDISAEALAINRRVAAERGVAGRLTTVVGKFQEAAYDSPGFADAVTYFKTLHHFPDLASIEEAIVAGYEVVRPGGVLLGLEPNGDCPFWRPGLLARGVDRRAGQLVWLLERNLLLVTERNLAGIFRRLPGARWELRWEYPIPAVVANRLPRLCAPLNRMVVRTPLRRRAFNLTFRVWKPPAAGIGGPEGTPAPAPRGREDATA